MTRLRTSLALILSVSLLASPAIAAPAPAPGGPTGPGGGTPVVVAPPAPGELHSGATTARPDVTDAAPDTGLTPAAVDPATVSRAASYLVRRSKTWPREADDVAAAVVALSTFGDTYAADAAASTDWLVRQLSPDTPAHTRALVVTALTAQGRDPRAVGGLDLVAGLEADLADGSCGDETWPFVTELCMIAVARAEGTVPSAAVDHLAAHADPVHAGILTDGGVELYSTVVAPQALALVDGLASRMTALGARDFVELTEEAPGVLRRSAPLDVNALAAQTLIFGSARARSLDWLASHQLSSGALPDVRGGSPDLWTTAQAVLAWQGESLVGPRAAGAGYAEHATVDRVTGHNRYEVAAAISDYWSEGAGTVVISSGENFADALSGSAYAGRQHLPILLAKRDSLPTVTRAAIERLGARSIVILGGPASISADVERSLQRLLGTDSVIRVGGLNRYAVSANISASWSPGVSHVYLASGENWPDGLAGGAVAGSQEVPLLLTKTDGVPRDVLAALRRLRPGSIYVLGGTTAVEEKVVDSLRAEFVRVRRISAPNRYDLAAILSQEAGGAENGFVASGENWPDALAGGALAAALDSPVLLAKRDSLPRATAGNLGRDFSYVGVFGGPAAVGGTVVGLVRVNAQ